MTDIRALFDAILEEFREIHTRLAPSVPIKQDLLFESGIVKIQCGNHSGMSSEEKRAVYMLVLSAQEITNDCDGVNLSFAERVLKQRKEEDRVDCQIYRNMNFLLLTSNICETLFSRGSYLLNDRRNARNPANLESQIFTH